ncbi:MAG TPA: hypothetical protein VNJ04_19580 [Gemmatimonadaceae bacterium]|nr:hypothetical protein [Gemmatimonadaceae bacterium]
MTDLDYSQEPPLDLPEVNDRAPQERDAALVELVAEAIRETNLISIDKPYANLRESTKDIWRDPAREVIETVREYDMDASAPWPLPQEMP